MKTIELKYKAETGNRPFTTYEPIELSEWLDPDFLTNMTAKEIVGLIKYEKPKPGYLFEDIDPYFKEADKLKLYTPEYIQWLEEKNLSNHNHIKTDTRSNEKAF